jgi:CHASE3 domain sensor protein
MTGQLDALDRYNKALQQVYKDLEQLDQLSREKPSKEQVIKCLERMFSELEEGKIILSPSLREHFEMEKL